jgi:hypothetical protein
LKQLHVDSFPFPPFGRLSRRLVSNSLNRSRRFAVPVESP